MAGLSKRKYDIQFYVKVVEKFVQTGECAKTLYGETEDSLLLYLLAIMNDPSIRVLVLGNEVVHAYSTISPHNLSGSFWNKRNFRCKEHNPNLEKWKVP